MEPISSSKPEFENQVLSGMEAAGADETQSKSPHSLTAWPARRQHLFRISYSVFPVYNLIKPMDTDVKEMTKLTTDIEKATIAARKAYDQAGKGFK